MLSIIDIIFESPVETLITLSLVKLAFLRSFPPILLREFEIISSNLLV